MNIRLLVYMTWMLFSGAAKAATHPTIRHHPDSPLCEQDLSDLRLPRIRELLVLPEGLEDRGLRPGLLHVQQEVCRCLPRRRSHQPSVIWVLLHIKPNAGEVRVQYHIEPPWTRAMSRMVECLGEPILTVEPMKYRSDIITEDGPLEEVLSYPIEVELGEDGVRKGRSQRRE